MFSFLKRKNSKIDTQSHGHTATETPDGLIITEGMDFVGGHLFNETGKEFLNYFVDFCGLGKDTHVLDVGCGIGRMAIPLTSYLSEKGSYRGFDIVLEGIDWCKSNISHRFPNFEFSHSNIYNKQYNPNGKIKASEYRFPYEDASFDFIFLTSVFTHMLPVDLNSYFSEIGRVLKPGGNTLITYFILNEESEKNISQGLSHIDISNEFDSIKVLDMDMPEASTGYSENQITSLYSEHGMNIQKPIRYGNWCGRSKFTSYQDIIIAKKIIS